MLSTDAALIDEAPSEQGAVFDESCEVKPTTASRVGSKVTFGRKM